MNRISFGVRVPNSGPLSSIENIVKATKQAEELGFDAVWVHDHVVWSSEMHRHHISSGAAGTLREFAEVAVVGGDALAREQPRRSSEQRARADRDQTHAPRLQRLGLGRLDARDGRRRHSAEPGTEQLEQEPGSALCRRRQIGRAHV